MKKIPCIVLLLSVAMLWSCAGKRSVVLPGGVTPAGNAPGEADEEVLMEKVASTQLPYTWFAGSGQGKIDWDGQRMSASFNVRILRDSIIWVQISKLGFEVGRMLVTPDSAFFINRFERSYGLYKTAEFLEEYRVPADFRMFSAVFTAGAYMPEWMQPKLIQDSGAIAITGKDGTRATYWFDQSAVLIRAVIVDPLLREWSAGFSDYRPLPSGDLWPHARSNTLVIDGEANIFDLEYKNVEINVPQTFPFSIPSHYEKI
jgi:hypothetical protein